MANLGDGPTYQPYPNNLDTRTELKEMKEFNHDEFMKWARVSREAIDKMQAMLTDAFKPKPRWQDVTGECEFRICKDGTALSHHWEEARPEIGCNVMVNQAQGYRLRKVQLYDGGNLIAEGRTSLPGEIPPPGRNWIENPKLKWAFIVERKVG